MNWFLFYSVFAIAFVLSYPTFKALNALSIRLGQVPQRGNWWHGRRFSYMDEETTLVVGNPFFFSLMDALIAISFGNVKWTIIRIIWASISIAIGTIVTISWFADATNQYKSGQIPSWGWQWCNWDTISVAGRYHTIYFWIHAVLISSVLTFFFWQSGLNIHCKVGMGFATLGYFFTFSHFVFIQKRLHEVSSDDASKT